MSPPGWPPDMSQLGGSRKFIGQEEEVQVVVGCGDFWLASETNQVVVFGRLEGPQDAVHSARKSQLLLAGLSSKWPPKGRVLIWKLVGRHARRGG